MIRLGQALRLIHINVVLVRHGLDEIVLATHLFRPIRFLLYLLPRNQCQGRDAPKGAPPPGGEPPWGEPRATPLGALSAAPHHGTMVHSMRL